jgi:hypothetical protein
VDLRFGAFVSTFVTVVVTVTVFFTLVFPLILCDISREFVVFPRCGRLPVLNYKWRATTCLLAARCFVRGGGGKQQVRVYFWRQGYRHLPKLNSKAVMNRKLR